MQPRVAAHTFVTHSCASRRALGLPKIHQHLMTIPLTQGSKRNEHQKWSVRAAFQASKVPRIKPSESLVLAPSKPGIEVSRQSLMRGNDIVYLFKPLPVRGSEKPEKSIGRQGRAGAVAQVGKGVAGTASSGGGVFVQSVKGNFWSDQEPGGCSLLPAPRIA